MEKICGNCLYSTERGVDYNELICNFYTETFSVTKDKEVVPAGISVKTDYWCRNWNSKDPGDDYDS